MRSKFFCVRCGLRFEGLLGARGLVKAYDRAPSKTDPSIGGLCAGCLELEKAAEKVKASREDGRA